MISAMMATAISAGADGAAGCGGGFDLVALQGVLPAGNACHGVALCHLLVVAAYGALGEPVFIYQHLAVGARRGAKGIYNGDHGVILSFLSGLQLFQ